MRNLAALWNGLLFTIAWPLCTVAAATQQAPLSPAKPVVAPKTAAFKPGQVRLLEGVFRESREAEAKYMLSLDVDRLLVPYRVGVGLPAKAEAYGGWEKRNLPGVGLAFYLSGLVRLAAETGEPEYARRLTYILDEFETCQRDGGGYLLGTSDGRAILSRVEREGYWEGFGKFSTDGRATPYYSMEKLFSGLRDAWRIGHSHQNPIRC